MAALIADLGFVTTIGGSKGIVRLSHPELIVEFLVPEKGKGREKPVELSQLGINAVALRFLDFLAENIIRIPVEDFKVRLPHPTNFSLHKLIVSGRRGNKDKGEKDRLMAAQLLRILIAQGFAPGIKKIYGAMPVKWKREVLNALNEDQDSDILEIIAST